MLKIPNLVINIEGYQKNMTEENISQEFRLKEIDKARNYFIEEIKQNELINKRHKKVHKIINYTEHLHILASIVTGCGCISAFASLIGIFVGIVSSAATIKIYVISAGIKKNKSIIKEKKMKHDKLMKSWLEKNAIKMYSTHNEEKSAVAERFIRTRKSKILTMTYLTTCISRN